MRKLLRANLYCLRKSKALLLCMAAAFGLSVFFMLNIGTENEDMHSLDEIFTQVLPFLPILHAAFVSLFLGIEYQDGTIRNKIAAGHSRTAVYGAFLITSIVGCFAVLAAWLMSAVVGVIRFGWFSSSAGTLLMSAALILLLTAAEAAILTTLCISVTNRASSAVAAILLMFCLIAVSSALYNALCEPEMTSAAIMTANGVEIGEAQANPRYIGGTLREIFRLVLDSLPSGQAILLANGEIERPVLSLCASAVITLIVGAAGSAIFKRKDLK